MHKIRQ